MKRIFAFGLAVALVLFLSGIAVDSAAAQTAGKQAGKGVTMHGPLDDDGDGIVNHNDPDHVRPKDGTGHQFGKANKGTGNGALNQFGQGKGMGNGQGRGKNCIGPRDGSGTGTGTGTGVCDGTGPKGFGRR